MTSPTKPAATGRVRAGHVVDLWAYLAGDLTPARARAAERHVLECAVCAARARRLRAILEACRTAGCQQLPADVRARAKARVKALVRSR